MARTMDRPRPAPRWSVRSAASLRNGPAVLLAACYAHPRPADRHCLAIVMLVIGPSAGQDLLARGPAWAWPLAVLQRECLVGVGIWCCVTFLIRAIRAGRDRAPETGAEPAAVARAPGVCWTNG